MLSNVGSVNIFDYVDQTEATEGDVYRVYFQLIDATQDKALKGFKPAGRRWAPAAGATLTATLNNIDDAKVLTRGAVQAFPTLDASIWYVQVLATDFVRGTVDIALVLNESGVLTRGVIKAAVSVASQGNL